MCLGASTPASTDCESARRHKWETLGREQLDDYIGGAHSRYPGMRIERASALDAHHDVARFGWRLVLGDGSTALEGIDFVQFAADGRIGRIVGFFGPLRWP